MSDEEVGYKKPPVQHRFKPGNKAAAKRSKKAMLSQSEMVDAIMEEKVEITVSGQRRIVTRAEVQIRSLVAQAAQGKQAAIRALEAIRSKPSVAAGSLNVTVTSVRAPFSTIPMPGPHRLRTPAEQDRAEKEFQALEDYYFGSLLGRRDAALRSSPEFVARTLRRLSSSKNVVVSGSAKQLDTADPDHQLPAPESERP